MRAGLRRSATARRNRSAQRAMRLAGSRIAVVTLFIRSNELAGDAGGIPLLNLRIDVYAAVCKLHCFFPLSVPVPASPFNAESTSSVGKSKHLNLMYPGKHS